MYENDEARLSDLTRRAEERLRETARKIKFAPEQTAETTGKIVQDMIDRQVRVHIDYTHLSDGPGPPPCPTQLAKDSGLHCPACGANRWRCHDGTLECLYCEGK